MAVKLVLTCEHASNKLPKKYAKLIPQKVLNTHRGYDIGSQQLYHFLKKNLKCYAQAGNYSRLLIELNRPLNSKQLFSRYSNTLTEPEKQALIKDYYEPYIDKLTQKIAEYTKSHLVVHIAIHSFTPKLNGVTRQTDIGLLYDPKRKQEKQFCTEWRQALQKTKPYRIRMNYPYKGSSPGLTTTLRTRFKKNYIGIELEMNQKFSLKKQLADLQITLLMGLSEILKG